MAPSCSYFEAIRPAVKWNNTRPPRTTSVWHPNFSIGTAAAIPLRCMSAIMILHRVTGNMDLLPASPWQDVNIPRSFVSARTGHTFWLQVGLLMGCLYIIFWRIYHIFLPTHQHKRNISFDTQPRQFDRMTLRLSSGGESAWVTWVSLG